MATIQHAEKRLRQKIQMNLRSARLAQGYTEEEIGKKAKVETRVVKLLENGKTSEVHLGSLIRVSWALGLVLSDLTGEKRSGITPREFQLIKMYRFMNVVMRRRLLYVAMALTGELDDEEEKIRLSTRKHGVALGRSKKDLDDEMEFDSVFGTFTNTPEEKDESCQDFPMVSEQENPPLTETTDN